MSSISDSNFSIRSNDENNSDINKKIETLLKPLSNPVRQNILILLSQGPITYTEIYNHLKLESGSFYWHIKKMEALIDQTEDKKYYLSDFGKKAFQLLYSEHEMDDPSDPPELINNIVSFTNKLHTTPNWIILQQILFILTITSLGFSSVDIIQLGSIPYFYERSDFLISFITLALSVFVPSFILIFVLLVNERRNSRVMSRNETIALLFQILLVNSVILLPGLFSSLIILIAKNPNFALEFYIIIPLVFISTIFSLLLLIGVIISNLGYDYKTATVIVLISFYPYLIGSFTLQFLN